LEREKDKGREFLFFKRKTLTLAAFKWSYFKLFKNILKTIQEKIFVHLVNQEQRSISINI